jgi:hypothetical protein
MNLPLPYNLITTRNEENIKWAIIDGILNPKNLKFDKL